jgi:ATP-dependent DNA helicase RecG
MNWDELDIEREIALGEDSSRQFKEKIEKPSDLAKEMCAFSNSRGGVVYIGVKDDLAIAGLTTHEIGEYNKMVANVANENLKPAIYPLTKVVEVKDKLILLIYITSGTSKPYCTNEGVYWVKSGSDKRRSSPQELLRMFQQSSMMYLDETPTSAELTGSDVGKVVNLAKFYTFYERSRGEEFSKTGVAIEKALENMNLAKEGKLTLAGLLLFGNDPQNYKPFCLIRAISYYGTEISEDRFKDRNDFAGTLEDQFRGAMNFLKNNLSFVQKEGSFNQSGELEVSEKALEEAVVNALLHRDYSKNAVIRLLIFKDRIELISPGSLPNHLTVQNILSGNSVTRNPIIVSYATKILPYSGIGSGIPRIIKNHPNTKLVDVRDGEQFVITLFR